MEKMTSPERVVAAFAHEAVDRVPMIILDGGAWVCEHAGVSYDQMYATGDLGAQIVVDAYDLLGSDTITCGLGSWMGWLHGVGCPVNMSKIGKPMEVEPCLADIVAEVPTLDPSTARASLEADEHVARMLEQTRNIKSIVGDRKLLITTLCAPFTAAGTMAGVSGYMKIARKTPEIVDPLVDYAVAACAAIADLMCENGCDIIAFCDPSASGDMISPKLFERLSAPALKKLRGAVTSAKIFFLHICGNTIMRIPTVNTLGVDGFSIDFKVNLAEALSAAAPNLTILGNIAPSDLLMSGTPQEVYDESYRCVELGGLEGGYVLMPGCDIPAQCALENVLAMTRAAEDYAAKVRA